ncbi:MAG: hypothetical protein K8S25_12710, partial [Alphaproteobacteria bacterium]|nr:hypothetical protein [Alphaproteobacteria bacterium]
ELNFLGTVMDRQIILVVGFAVFCMSALGGMILGSGSPNNTDRSTDRDVTRPTYAKDDIRYKLQQAEAKLPKKKHKQPEPAPEQHVSSDATSSGGGDDGSGDEANEEPSLADEPEAEEPPIE